MSDYENFDANSYATVSNETEIVPRKGKISDVLRDEDFGTHFRVFLIIMGSLFALDWLTRGGWWFQYVLISWGIGVSCHFWDTYLNFNYNDSEKKDLLMHGAVTGTLVIFFLLMDFFTGGSLNWWYWPSVPLIMAWLLHRATVFNKIEDRSNNQPQSIAIKSIPTKRKFCANCGEEIEPDFKFCKYCGRPL